jgi:hypothetical protein
VDRCDQGTDPRHAAVEHSSLKLIGLGRPERLRKPETFVLYAFAYVWIRTCAWPKLFVLRCWMP